MEELVELQLQEETRLEKLFDEQRRELGLDSEVTLATFFKLFDMWIQLYRLNKCMEVLVDAVPICRRLGGQLHIQGVQALAFTTWKLGKFKQAVELFHEIEGLVGASAALCENIGHTYSSMGNYEEASRYFKMSLVCHDTEAQLGKRATSDKGGVLLGLGLIEDRLGRLESALEACRKAQVLFREKAAGKPSSLIAKAGMSIAKILLKMAKDEQDEAKQIEMEEEAIGVEEENIEIFEVTCGEESPLTASALKGLGEALMRRSRFKDAQCRFARSYLLEAQKDAFDLLAVMEVHNSLFAAHMGEVHSGQPLDRASFSKYLATIDVALARVQNLPQDGNAGAYYKVAGEFRAFAEDYSGAAKLLGKAVQMFLTEEPDKVAGLIEASEDLKVFCERQSHAQASKAPQSQWAS